MRLPLSSIEDQRVRLFWFKAATEDPGAAMIDPPALTHLADLDVDVGAIEDLGVTPEGRRRLVAIRGGRVRGRLSGRILAGGADYQLIRPDGVLELEARYVIETDDGARVYVVNTGIRHAAPDVAVRLNAGETVDPALVYFRSSPRFMSADPGLAWLARRIFVAVGARHPDRVALSVFEVG